MLSVVSQSTTDIEQQLAAFRTLENDIVAAIESQDSMKISVLDQEINARWHSVLLLEPEFPSESHQLVEFFIDQIIEKSDSDKVTAESKARILTLLGRT